MTFGSGVIMSVADGTCLNATCADFSALLPAFHCVRLRRGPQRAVVARREPGLPQRRAQRQRVPGPVRRQGRHGRPLPLRRRCRADVGRAGGPDHHAGRAAMGARCLANGETPVPPPPSPPPHGPYTLNKATGMGGTFDSSGAISGGGATRSSTIHVRVPLHALVRRGAAGADGGGGRRPADHQRLRVVAHAQQPHGGHGGGLRVVAHEGGRGAQPRHQAVRAALGVPQLGGAPTPRAARTT